jgi:hypothetical protein
MKSLRNAPYLLFALLLFALTGCGATGGNLASPAGSTPLTAKVVGMQSANVTKIRLMVTGSDIPTARKDFDGAAGTLTGGTVEVYPGSGLIVSAQAFDASNSILFEGFVTNVTVGTVTPANVTVTMNAPVVKTVDQACLGCHETTRDKTGQNLIADFKQSGHYTNTTFTTNTKNGSTLPGCAGCHGTQHKDVDPSASGRCWECHGSSLGANHQYNGSTTNNCTSCHRAHNSPVIPSTYSLSGKVISDVDGSGLPGVIMTISGTGTVTGASLTDINGNYSFTNVLNGSYSIRTNFINVGSTPASQSVAVNNANVTGLDFTVNLSGDIQVSLGNGLAGISTIKIQVTGPIPTISKTFAYGSGTISMRAFPGNNLIVTAQALDATGTSLFEGFARNVTVTPGATTSVSPTMAPPVVKATDTICLACHDSTRDQSGQNLVAIYKQSGHYTNTNFTTNTKNDSTLPGCAGCHGTQHNDLDPSASGRCWECHEANMPVIHPDLGGSRTNCSSCHNPHYPKL